MITKMCRFVRPDTITVIGGYYFYGSNPPTSGDDPSLFTRVTAEEGAAMPLFQKYVELATNQWMVSDSLYYDQFGPHFMSVLLVDGQSTSKTFDDKTVRVHDQPFKNFEARLALGEIMVSDFSHSKASARYTQGEEVLRKRKAGTSTFWLTDTGSRASKALAIMCGYSDFNTSSYIDRSMVKVAPNVWVSLAVSYEWWDVVFEIGPTAPDYGFDFSRIESLIAANEDWTMESQCSIDGAQVTAVVAKANSGDVDLLTFLSELPMTIATSLHGFAKVGSMAKDLRTLDVKKSRISRSVLQKWRKDHWHQLRKKVPKKRTPRDIFQRYESVATALAGELLDATATVNLWWRYDLRPNLYTLDDHLDHVWNMLHDNGRRRYRVKSTIPFDMPAMPGFTWQGEAYHEDRYTCIRHYYLSDWLGKVKRSLRTDKVVTLWELLWGSFMVDWLLNIGDVLAAMPVHDPLLKCDEGYTYSRRTVVNGYYVKDDNPSVQAHITVNGYKRAKIDPKKYIRIYYRNNLDLWKMFDAACIAWGLSRPKLRKTPIFTFL